MHFTPHFQGESVLEWSTHLFGLPYMTSAKKAGQEILKNCGQRVLNSTHLCLRECVNPASWLPLDTNTIFTQPFRETYALQSTELD